MTKVCPRSLRPCLALLATAAALTIARPVPAEDVSAPAILQWFDSSYGTIEHRAPDLFQAGYGAIWLPPPGRADSGNQSVGYDVYDRFDLGKPGDPTLYGTETGLRTVASTLDRVGADLHIDFVINHNGFHDSSTPGFVEAGDYPGFVTTLPDDIDGDFHSAFAGGGLDERLAGLIDIAQEKDHRFVRNPVPGAANNIPFETPLDSNRRFYPDLDAGPVRHVFDPITGETDIPIYGFSATSPLSGDPVEENAMGYLMRNAQWLVEVIGVDGFRIDAAKHVPMFALQYFDRAVYRANPRTLLDGSTAHVFSYGEVFDGNVDTLLSYTRKDIDPNDPGRIGGNRDALDFSLKFALDANLSDNGAANDWRNVAAAGMDLADDGLRNGSRGVLFVASHDDGGAAMSNVAHAYVLTQPGQAVVYFDAQEHGDRDFPKAGRGDALGGVYGDAITRLVDIRNTHGRGDYRQRLLEKETLIYERSGSMLVALSNRNDAGFDTRRIDVDLPWGTPMIELTGNAARHGDVPEIVVVDNDYFEGPSKVTLRALRNDGQDQGYLVYGLAGPRSAEGVELDGVAQVLAGTTPSDDAYANATTRLSDVHVVTGDALGVTLRTQPVTLQGTQLVGDELVPVSIRDRDADGDNALLKLDDGVDVNGNGQVDFVTPGSVAYGFEAFADTATGYADDEGHGLYQQTLDTTTLTEGMHYLTARAFRHRSDGGPAVFSDFKQAIYIDRLPPESTIASFDPITEGVNENRSVSARSVDLTADNIHVLLNVGAALSDAEVLDLIGDDTQARRLDRDLWQRDLLGLTHGNQAITLVSFEMTGNVNVQRFAGLFTSTIFGAGLGDVDFDGGFTAADVDVFADLLAADNRLFNPAADLDGDGWIDRLDLDLLGNALAVGGADAGTMARYNELVATVPEPATAAMLLTLVGVITARRRQ